MKLAAPKLATAAQTHNTGWVPSSINDGSSRSSESRVRLQTLNTLMLRTRHQTYMYRVTGENASFVVNSTVVTQPKNTTICS